ncbi:MULTISPECIES: ferredoxin-type protein NapF [Vibrio]|uniref:ferredoxin-type protein NapF n=1 Tax=Vibrio TaxID=662 RepID=UPI000C8421AA|nr:MULTISPECIES: ferredoxin-type protein NapF [Vibrio]MCY9824621.1 ferredoxin-type protein NapF [Vibrio chagasii]PML78498.1 ferredoxin-type protein NapF [Vibrio sp. 10N.261.52.A1]
MVDLSKRRLFSRKKVDSSQIRLPWIHNLESFVDDCTRCGKCIESCETKIIIVGDGGFPTVDFSIDECTFCYQCADVCPEPIFKPKQGEPWQAKARISDKCLAQQNVECRSCGDMCEPMAIQFQLRAGSVALPKIELDECSGCGACVAVCPTSAILVSNA